MRIEDMGSRTKSRFDPLRAERPSSSPLANIEHEAFDDVLSDNHKDNLHRRLAALLKEIGKQGQKLTKSLGIRELLKYKRLIRDFLDNAISNAYMLYKDNHFDRNGGHHIQSVIKTIDHKLEELTEKVLDEEKDRLLILGYIDDIRGLLMDIIT